MISEFFLEDTMQFLSLVKNYDFTTESQITDRKPVLTDQEIKILKKIKLSDMIFGQPYASDKINTHSMNVFDISSSKDSSLKVVVSNRAPSCGELRGTFLIQLLNEAKEENQDQTVFEAIESKVTTLEYNTLALMTQRFFCEGEKAIVKDVFNKHKKNFYKNDIEIKQALEEAVLVVSRLMEAATLSEVALNDNNDVLTENTKTIFHQIKQTLEDFSHGELTFTNLKETCNKLGENINQLEISKYQGYSGIQKVLSMIAFLLLSVLSLGVANIISYQSSGSFVFFKGDNNKFEEKQKVNEVGSLILSRNTAPSCMDPDLDASDIGCDGDDILHHQYN
ncbi:hypothetical protein [uncultured Legionella sp.]|uniref:hypothetical protein n=1 Tax=uncultured Legionella sp. TaxID=210934 RepID=UPI002638E08B|nr:hypothetical protein [uncultured Legionella sp.]